MGGKNNKKTTPGKHTVAYFVILVFFLKNIPTVSDQSNPLLFFYHPHPSLSEHEAQSLSQDQELQNWRKTETNVIAHTVSHMHARTHTHTPTRARARTRTPPPEFCLMCSVPSCEVPPCHRQQPGPLGLWTPTPSPRLGVGRHRMYVLGHTVVAS